MASLLDRDPDPNARALALTRARDAYRWDHEYLQPLPMLQIGRQQRQPGIVELLRGSFFELPHSERPDDDMPEQRIAATVPALPALALDEVRARLGHAPTEATDYLRLLEGVPTAPTVEGNRSWAADWDSDFAFARQRLAGPNPVVVERPDPARWTELRPRLGLDDGHVQQALGEGAPALEQLLTSGRLFVCDYAVLESPTPIPCGVSEGRQKYLPAPIVAFAWDDRREELVPIAIRAGQRPDAPLVVRDGSDRWLAAKAMAAAADFSHHEMGTHLCNTHFVEEGIWVATRRSLPPMHPVAALLAPHFKYLLLNNFAGRELLVEPGGFVEKVLAGELEQGSLELVRRSYERFSFDDLDLPSALRRRNVEATAGLPVYPYRDDGLLVWAAVGRWIRGYVEGYWSDDASVAGDTELARWCQELTSPEGAHLKGFPERIETREALATVLERIVFLAGPQHAAVNYPQAMSMLVVPNLPGAAYTAEPGRLIDALPPLGAAAAQVEIIWTLTCYRYGRLGQYGPAMTDPSVQAPLARFQAELEGIDSTIDERNRTVRKTAPYLYLSPSRIPNSTNV